jgi:hypothetical protein
MKVGLQKKKSVTDVDFNELPACSIVPQFLISYVYFATKDYIIIRKHIR